MRTTNGIATSACAIGTSSGDVRRSSGGVSRVIRNPKPSVTALTPSGTLSSPSSRPPARPGGRERGESADGHRDRGRDQGVDDRVADRVGGRDEQDAPRTHAAEGAVVAEAGAARCVERARHEDGDGRTQERAHHEQVHDDDGPLAPRARSAGDLGGRPQPQRGRPATLGPTGERQQRDHGDELHDRQRGREREVQGLRRLAVDLRFERAARRAAQDEDHAERGEREEEGDRGRGGRARAAGPAASPTGTRPSATRRAPAPPLPGAGRGGTRARRPSAPRPRS